MVKITLRCTLHAVCTCTRCTCTYLAGDEVKKGSVCCGKQELCRHSIYPFRQIVIAVQAVTCTYMYVHTYSSIPQIHVHVRKHAAYMYNVISFVYIHVASFPCRLHCPVVNCTLENHGQKCIVGSPRFTQCNMQELNATCRQLATYMYMKLTESGESNACIAGVSGTMGLGL